MQSLALPLHAGPNGPDAIQQLSLKGNSASLSCKMAAGRVTAALKARCSA